MNKYRIAFIHTTGLCPGGTEQFLQRLAVDLPKDIFDVDFYYANNTAEHRKNFVDAGGVNTIKFNCGQIIEKKGLARAYNCDFKNVFKNNYDLIMLGTDGAEISYLNFIKSTPIIDSIHYIAGANNRYNISRVMHISEFSRNKWVEKGGDKKRTVMISLPLRKPVFTFTDIRSELGLSPDTFIFGMHQANRDDIFSDIPLKAFKEVENDNNAYVLLNGSKLYRNQAKELGLKNIYFYDYVKDNDKFYSIINSFNVYAHGRKDGELNSAALAEAMSLGLPIISHPSSDFNGHLEVIKGNGFIANNHIEYAEKMRLLEQDTDLRTQMGLRSIEIFNSHYDHDAQMQNIINIFLNAINDPYPDKLRRRILSDTQSIKNFLLYYVIGLYKKVILK